jgi:hypothetical protein
MRVNRFIVNAGIRDGFLAHFTDRVSQLKVGDPDAPDTMVGPIINESQLNGLRRLTQKAAESGARQVMSGEAQGITLPPHVFAEVTNEMPIARTESFGPIAPVIRRRAFTSIMFPFLTRRARSVSGEQSSFWLVGDGQVRLDAALGEQRILSITAPVSYIEECDCRPAGSCLVI